MNKSQHRFTKPTSFICYLILLKITIHYFQLLFTHQAHNTLLSFGKEGETAAADFLTEKGYSILHRNWRCGKKELDIVAKYNNELIVVEVKSRKDIRFGNPEEAVNDRKIRHIIASTDAYLRKFAIDLPVRFDIITVVGQEAPFQIEHIADAFYSPIR